MDDPLGDEQLLSAAGWSGVPSARILARAATSTACVLALDSNGGQGGRTYVTVEMLARTDGQAWESIGDWGPADGGGTGWFDGHAYAIGHVGHGIERVLVQIAGEVVERLVKPDGWWAAITATRHPTSDPVEVVEIP